MALLAVIICVTIALTLAIWIMDKIKLSSQGSYILITGCDTGFGNLLAKSLDKQGCHVFATCLASDGAKSLKKVSSDRMHTILMDVTDSESIKAAFEQVNEILVKDSATLWGLVNNAAVPGKPGYYDWYQREDFRRILDVNLLGPVEVTNVFLPLVRGAKGRVVNMSSGMALAPFSFAGYEMAKCGLEAFSDCLRQQLRYTSTSVHIIEPGFFATYMTDADRTTQVLEDVWKNMTPTQRSYYGRECIDQSIHSTKESAILLNTSLFLVTDAIEHALFARYPWKRYPVTGLVRFVARPVSVLPAIVGDFILSCVVPLPKPKGAK